MAKAAVWLMKDGTTLPDLVDTATHLRVCIRSAYGAAKVFLEKRREDANKDHGTAAKPPEAPEMADPIEIKAFRSVNSELRAANFLFDKGIDRYFPPIGYSRLKLLINVTPAKVVEDVLEMWDVTVLWFNLASGSLGLLIQEASLGKLV